MTVRRVLVVDDKLDMAEMIADDLCERGYEAMAVSSGKAALLVMGTQRIDALVTDLRMPGLDGLALIDASQKLDPSRPVILMTAFSAIDSAMRAFEAGAYQYIMKPFRLDALAQALDRALGGTKGS
jgi:two-component system, NtrC family, response regulator HydG